MQATRGNYNVTFFAAPEVDARGIGHYGPLVSWLDDLRAGGVLPALWPWSLDTGRQSVTTNNRLAHITMGQNLAKTYADNNDVDAILFMAADCAPPYDAIPKLAEVLDAGYLYVGAHIPTYCLAGSPTGPDRLNLTDAMPSAACVMTHHRRTIALRWRADPDRNLSDDPAMARDIREVAGSTPVTRMDCVASHYPESISSIETRGYDLDLHL
jgi:hypothetical protein